MVASKVQHHLDHKTQLILVVVMVDLVVMAHSLMLHILVVGQFELDYLSLSQVSIGQNFRSIRNIHQRYPDEDHDEVSETVQDLQTHECRQCVESPDN